MRNAIGTLLLLVSCTACAPATRPVSTSRGIVAVASRRAVDPEPEVAARYTGLAGGIDPRSVEVALEPQMDALAACVEQRRDVARSARLSVVIRIASDGTVRSAVPASSTIGDRDAERCALDVIAGTRFRAPSGGEADATWTFEVGAGEREEWDGRRARAALRAARSSR